MKDNKYSTGFAKKQNNNEKNNSPLNFRKFDDVDSFAPKVTPPPRPDFNLNAAPKKPQNVPPQNRQNAVSKPSQNLPPQNRQTTASKPSPNVPPKAPPKPAPAKKFGLFSRANNAIKEQKNNYFDKKIENRKTPLKIIPLGGLGEIGKNMTCYEYGNDIFIVDCGLAFPDSDMLGIDIVIPDFDYVRQNASKIRGIVLTHGHEDHIGGVSYLLRELNVPIYGTRLTIGLLEGKLKDAKLFHSAKLNVVKPRDTIKMGCMAVEFIRVNHSIPDAVALGIHTPVGVVVQTGDFKVDFTPIEGEIIDLSRFAELGSKGVIALLSDSTNAERPGYTTSEKKVGESLEQLFKRAEDKRIIIASFASNIHRIQQIIDCAVKYNRKVSLSGRSMINATSKAIELGYLKVPSNVLIDLDMVNQCSPNESIIITTGSQGEPMSALSRMAMKEHRKITVNPQDFIIISASPIPGNEKFVSRIVNELLKTGAEVIYEAMYEIHVSGHACQEELKLMLALTKPKYFIPVHGEFKHLKKHSELALSIGMKKSDVVIAEIGDVIEVDNISIKKALPVQAGNVLVDGLGVGDVGNIVLRDRKHLGLDGLIIVVMTIDSTTGDVVAGPDIVSRGFVYVRESEEIMNNARSVVNTTLDNCIQEGIRDWTCIKNKVRDALSGYVYNTTKRSPMILPIIMDI